MSAGEQGQQWWKDPDFVAQQEQIKADGPLQASQNALLRLGTSVEFTFGPDRYGGQEVYLATVTRITPIGDPVLTVFEEHEGRPNPTLRHKPYFSSAKPGTPLAAGCWGWPGGGSREHGQ